MKKRSNFTPMERFREILHGNGLQSMNVGTNHIRIFKDGRKLFDYYPLRMKLFDYHDWHQLTYPFAGNGDRTWETELGNIIHGAWEHYPKTDGITAISIPMYEGEQLHAARLGQLPRMGGLFIGIRY